MKLFFLAISLLLSFASFAGVLKKSIPQSVLDKVNIGNSSVYIQPYNPTSFNVDHRLLMIKKWNSESACAAWSTEVSLENAIATLHVSGAQELAEILESLRLKNLLKTAIYNTASPSYDAANCSFYYYEIYSNDGDLLILDLDFNS